MITTDVVFAIFLLFLLAAIHPFVTYAPSLALLKRLRLCSPARPVADGRRPARSFAVCVCAYNEEAVIEEKIHNLLALREATPEPVEILLYVDAASDRTAAIARQYSNRLKLVVAAERRGKSAGMNRLAALATADVLVFSDANVMIEPQALRRLKPYFDDPTVGCVCGNLIYTNGAEGATAAVGSAYWRLEERIKQLESDTGGVIGADGSLFAIRRSVHVPVPEDIIDDFYLSLSILCDGYRVVRAGDVRAAETATTDSADEYRRKVRIACQAMNVHRLMRGRLARLPASLRYKYLSHKLLRWLSLINLGVSSLAFVLWLSLWRGWPSGLLAALLGGTLLALVLSGRPAAARRLREVLLALLATSQGMLRSLRGDRFQTWQPPVSRGLPAANPRSANP